MNSAATKFPTLTIRRPNGNVETVCVASKCGWLNDEMFEMFKSATAKAGRGDVLSYENAPAPKEPMFESMGPGWCNRCESYCYGDCQAAG